MLVKTFIFGLLASIPIAAALEVGSVGDALDIEKRSYTGSLAARAVVDLPKRHHSQGGAGVGGLGALFGKGKGKKSKNARRHHSQGGAGAGGLGALFGKGKGKGKGKGAVA